MRSIHFIVVAWIFDVCRLPAMDDSPTKPTRKFRFYVNDVTNSIIIIIAFMLVIMITATWDGGWGRARPPSLPSLLLLLLPLLLLLLGAKFANLSSPRGGRKEVGNLWPSKRPGRVPRPPALVTPHGALPG